MTKIRKSNLQYIIISVFLIMAGCAKPISVNPEITSPPGIYLPKETLVDETPDIQETPTKTTAPTSPSSISQTQTPEQTSLTPTQTPLPTLNALESQQFLRGLFRDNGGCQLPCWWGIIPGFTRWEDATQFLSSFAHIWIRGDLETKASLDVTITLPEEYGEIPHYYFVESGVIQSIRVYNFDLAESFYLPAFLETYGQPTEIYISTFREEDRGSQPFLLVLFYPELGILMDYSGGELVDLGDRLQNCLVGMNSPFIYLWSPAVELTFDQAKDRYLGLDSGHLPEPVSLEKATGVNEAAFYETMLQSGTICIETPKDLWP